MIHLSGALGAAQTTPPGAAQTARRAGGDANDARVERPCAIGGRAADVRPATYRDRCCRRAHRTALLEPTAPSLERAQAPARFHSGRAALPALGRAGRGSSGSAPQTARASPELPAVPPWRSAPV